MLSFYLQMEPADADGADLVALLVRGAALGVVIVVQTFAAIIPDPF